MARVYTSAVTVLLLVGAGLAWAYRTIARTERGRATFDRFWLGVPVVGRVIRLLAIARFARTLGSLLASSVNIVQALNIARHVANNSVFEAAADAARESILEGAALAVTEFAIQAKCLGLVDAGFQAQQMHASVHQLVLKGDGGQVALFR